MLTLYPPIKPYHQFTLPVDPPHELYVEECGNPDGIPILFVHGGPGSGCTEDQRRFFDPNIYRVILFDQRGCGRSTPHKELKGNNTHALVQDMERIRQQLKIDKWVLFGGSWGSTLSLVYAQSFPEKVLGMVLRGIFLNRNTDVQWLFEGHGANKIFPDYWEEFLSIVPDNLRNNPLLAYYEMLTGTDEVTRMSAAKTWSSWEGHCATLEPNKQVLELMKNPHHALSFALIECHYFLNNCFLEPNQIMRNMHHISEIPGIIVHGRYDIVCTLDNAWELHGMWPNSELNIIRDAGHSACEAGIIDALVRATKSLPSRLQLTTS
ncbi:MAG: prolyl aminopeptidase [Gammaproteobacteria bacterium]|nr:prolyl aminopeptidase [Gammaproteobacteria bacterium]